MGTLGELNEAIALLEDEARVVGLAARAMWETCPRGVAIAMTIRGARTPSVGFMRMVTAKGELPLEVPHAAFVKTPAYDMTHVPAEQRNRWVEPFREGIATREGFKKSSIYPFISKLGVLDQGRVAVCAQARQVAGAILAIPEATTFSDEERVRLEERALELVVPLRVSAILAAVKRRPSALEAFLDTADDAVLALDGDGTIVGASHAGYMALRGSREMVGALRNMPRKPRAPRRLCIGATIIHLSPSEDDALRGGWIAAIDAGAFLTPPRALTARQEELVQHLQKGLTNREIGETMNLAPSTIKTMLERLYRELNLSNRAELVSWAAARSRRR